MTQTVTSKQYLRQWAGRNGANKQLEVTMNALIAASVQIAELTSLGMLSRVFGESAARMDSKTPLAKTSPNDYQKTLSFQVHDILLAACREAPVAAMGSEEVDGIIGLDDAASLVVVVNPLDGSSNIETNAPIGTIFSIYPRQQGVSAQTDAVALQLGSAQLAAGYIIYGTQTVLTFTVGAGTHSFILDRLAGSYFLARENLQIPKEGKDYTVNALNRGFWHDGIQDYIQDGITSYADHNHKFNMRWIASLVAEAHRIFARGGVFLYPGDNREGYEPGRLCLVFEANAMAFLMEQAGGAATDCSGRIMAIQPESLHQKTALVMGSEANVEQVRRYLNFEEGGRYGQGKVPLFTSTGLFSSGRGNY